MMGAITVIARGGNVTIDDPLSRQYSSHVGTRFMTPMLSHKSTCYVIDIMSPLKLLAFVHTISLVMIKQLIILM